MTTAIILRIPVAGRDLAGSQVQALDRSQPVLPMTPGVPERRSRDHARAGTTALFAALDAASGR